MHSLLLLMMIYARIYVLHVDDLCARNVHVYFWE